MLNNLYQELILDHNKHPRNFGELSGATHKAEGYNPLCGDHFWVELQIDGENLQQINFHGQGCALSTASASMMTYALKGKSVEEAETMLKEINDFLSEEKNEPPEAFEVFSGIHGYPTRVKCVSLPWHAFKAALENETNSVRTE